MTTTRIRNEQITSESEASGKVLTADGSGNATWQAASGGSGSGTSTLLGVTRWDASSGQTDFTLPDTVDMLLTVSDNGSVVDPALYSLSSDGNTLTFASGITAGHVVVAAYLVLTA